MDDFLRKCSICGSQIPVSPISKIDFMSLVIHSHLKSGAVHTTCIGSICSKCQSDLILISTINKEVKNV